MFIFSTKVTRGKLLTLALVCACLAIVIIASVPGGEVDTAKKISLKAKTNEQRLEYLESFGWTVESEPTETSEIVIPTQFDETYENYNTMQLSQGFDLVSYKGKKATRYSYTVTNYPQSQEDPVYATLIVIDGRIVAGDIASTSLGGFMHSLVMPKDTVSEFETVQDELLPTATEILDGVILNSGK
ncbi:MAG: DUF4830 domain-containing protein [Clostridia bacterium]|nr:DUF4830 domain-containing protein [Clostridia bacterium]